ncbi:hypothetical protein V6O07_10285, partial [Arthrospira platensis SPKY2]
MVAGSNITFVSYLINLDQFEIARVQFDNQSMLLIIRSQTVTDRDGVRSRAFTATPFGLRNYQFAFTSPKMRIAFRNNLLWLIIGTRGSVSIGLIF